MGRRKVERKVISCLYCGKSKILTPQQKGGKFCNRDHYALWKRVNHKTSYKKRDKTTDEGPAPSKYKPPSTAPLPTGKFPNFI